MSCVSAGFWFEAGRALFGAAVVAAILVVFVSYCLWVRTR